MRIKIMVTVMIVRKTEYLIKIQRTMYWLADHWWGRCQFLKFCSDLPPPSASAIEPHVYGLEKYIEELQNKNQQKDNLIHQQKKKIYNLERKVSKLTVKAYRTDLRGMLYVFRKKVYIILFYSIFNTLILFLLLHVVGLDTVKKKTYGLPRWLAHQIFCGTSRNRRERR